jgi:hypothetical protein
MRVLMSGQTNLLVQTLDPATEDKFKRGALIVCRTAEGACRTVERLALSKASVVAFSTISDAETDAYGDRPTLFFRAPAEFDLVS